MSKWRAADRSSARDAATSSSGWNRESVTSFGAYLRSSAN